MLMKKIFTFIAAALFAVGASAQATWVPDGEAPAAGTKVIDNDLVTVETVFSTTAGSAAATIDGKEFTNWIQLRTAGAANADDPTGGDNGGSTPFVVTAKQNADLAVYFRRQYGSDGLNNDDNKDLLCYAQNGAQFETSEEVWDIDGSYGYAKKTIKVVAGGIYTLYRNGSTMRVYGIDVAEGTLTGGGNTGGGEVATGVRTWDFTNWSAETVANLRADAAQGYTEGWSDVEKNGDTEPTETSKDNCFWSVNTPNEKGELSANGVVIEELKGLVFGANVNNRGLAIAVNYPVALSTYHGPAYLWLGGANKQFFTIPAVAGGSTIKMGVESHKTTDARGVDLLVNGSSIGQFTPTTYDEYTWTIPAGEAVDVVVDNTNGCHIYFIEVADATSIQEVVKVINNGVVYNLAGQKVDENYKGVVIKNGKKMLQK